MKNIIFCDICNTLADISEMLNRALGPKPDPNQYFHPGATDDFFCKNLHIFANAKPIENANNVLSELAKKYSIVYLTARPSLSETITKDWLLKWNFPKGDIVHTINKAEYISNYSSLVQAEAFKAIAIDDMPEQIVKISKIFPVLVPKQPYNTGYKNRFVWNELTHEKIDSCFRDNREIIKVTKRNKNKSIEFER